MPLPDALADILFVVLHGEVVQFGLRLEIAHTEADAAMFETVAQYGDKSVLRDGVFKRLVELAHRIDGTHPFKAFPCHRLRGFHKVSQCHDVQIHAAALFAAQSCVRSFCPSAFFRNQVGLDEFLKGLFAFIHGSHHLSFSCYGLVDEGAFVRHKFAYKNGLFIY